MTPRLRREAPPAVTLVLEFSCVHCDQAVLTQEPAARRPWTLPLGGSTADHGCSKTGPGLAVRLFLTPTSSHFFWTLLRSHLGEEGCEMFLENFFGVLENALFLWSSIH